MEKQKKAPTKIATPTAKKKQYIFNLCCYSNIVSKTQLTILDICH